MDVLKFEDERAKEIIESGYVLAFPTETVYGLGIRWDSALAYERLCNAKKRIPSKPIAVMCGRNFDLDKYFKISENARRVIETFLPGPLTVLINAKENVPFQAHLGSKVVGLRIPEKESLLEFLENIPYPLQVTSANMSGAASTSDFNFVKNVFALNHDVKGIVHGDCVSSIPTTVVDLTGDSPIIVRQGEIKLEDIRKVFLGEK